MTDSERAAIEARDDGRGDIDRISSEALRPTTLMVGVLFTVFAIQNGLTYPPNTLATVVPYNIALAALGFALYGFFRRNTLSAHGTHIAAAVLSFAVLGQILVTTLYGVNPLFTHYVSILLIGTASSVLASGWIAAIGAAELAAWAVVAWYILPADQFRDHCLAMMTSAAAAVVVHVARRRSRTRVLELRAGDAQRERELQRALAEADEARRELDRKVEERTAALRNELAERERLEAQLRHAQKLEAVGRLAGGIAHDFNNLLTVIRLSHTTLFEPDASQDDRVNAMRDAGEAADRAAMLTHDLLAFARKQTLQRTTVSISAVLGSVERMVRRVAEATIRLEVRAAPDAGDIVADRHQIEQVLLNLAINACDAMNNRGSLTVTADAVVLDAAAASARRVSAGRYTQIAVTDTGTGMDESTRRSIFEPFFTTKEVGRGTGLGLAVAHGIISQHGGQIEVETALGKGSTFTVLLPASAAPAQPIQIAVDRPSAARAHETVLVVEDEGAVRRAVNRNLERLGYQVLAAGDGEAALRLVESRDQLDLLLTDVVMPGIDGPELACRLREKWPDLPVLFVTGYSADRLSRLGALGPHDRVLEKPYQLAQLTRTISEMLTERVSRTAALA